MINMYDVSFRKAKYANFFMHENATCVGALTDMVNSEIKNEVASDLVELSVLTYVQICLLHNVSVPINLASGNMSFWDASKLSVDCSKILANKRHNSPYVFTTIALILSRPANQSVMNDIKNHFVTYLTQET